MKKRRHIKSRNQDLLRKASIYDLIYRVAVHKQKNGKLDGTIKDIDLYNAPINDLMANLSAFLYNPDLEPENKDVCFLISDVLLRDHIIEYVKYIEPSIQELSIDELIDLSRKLSRTLHDKVIDFDDLKFLKQIVGFTVFVWEMSKRYALNMNLGNYTLNTSLALFYYTLWKKPDSQSGINYIYQRYLGLDLPKEMDDKFKKIASNISGNETDEAYSLLIENLNKVIEKKLSNLSSLELCKMGFIHDKEINYLPHATKRDLQDERKKQNRVIDLHGASTNKNNNPIEDIEDIPNFKEIENLIDINSWFQSLSNEREKKIAIMSYREGYTVREISQKLKIPKSTVQDIIKKLKPSN